MMSSQLERVQKVLSRNRGKNISADRLSTLANVPLDSVYRRVYDLRQTGLTITTTSKVVKGVRQQFYRVA